MKQYVRRHTPFFRRISKADFAYGCLTVIFFTLIGVILGQGF